MKEITVSTSTSPLLEFGASDTRAQRALATVRENLYLHKELCDNARLGAIEILDREYIGKGRDIFDLRSITAEMLFEFRQATAGAIDDLTDMEVRSIICFATQRVREFGNITQLRRARFKWAKIISDRGSKLPICEALSETFFRIRVAAELLEEIAMLPVIDQGYFVRQVVEIGQTESFVQSLRLSIRNRIVPESFTEKGFGIPPLHELCGCRIEGVDKEEVEERVSADARS